MNSKGNKMMVSVCVVTYNHERFIAQTIEGFVSQQVDFLFEVVIGEDCSKDNTRKICEEYAARYPRLINLLPSDRNYGPANNEARILRACTGKYIAMCEGDDYWTDPHKLQKQVDFLEANEEYSMAFADVGIIDEIGVKRPNVYPPLHKQSFHMEDIVTTGYCFIPTATLIFRNILPEPLPDFYFKALSGDIAVHLLLADKGKAWYFNEQMAVYRHHAGGITKTLDSIRQGDQKEFLLYTRANDYFKGKYDKIFRKRLLTMAKVMLIYEARDKKGFQRFRHYLKAMPAYLKYSNGINLKELAYYHTIIFFPWLLKLFKKEPKA